MADQKMVYGRTRIRPTAQLHLSFEWANPAAVELDENVVTFTTDVWHPVNGQPTAGLAVVAEDTTASQTVDDPTVTDTTPTSDPPLEPTDPTAVTVRNDLAFDVDSAPLKASTKKCIAHYFFTFPIAFTTSQDSPTAPDVDTRLRSDGTPFSTANQWHRWNPPSYGTYAVYGGEVRDRPAFMRAPRPKIESPTVPGKMLDYRVQDKMTEIAQAMSVHLDGFAPDWLDVPVNSAEYNLGVPASKGGAPLRWRQLIELYEAAAEMIRQRGAGSFFLVPMPDGSTNATKSSANLAKAIIYLEKTYPGVHYKRGGKLVLAPYYPEVAPSKAGTGSTPMNFWKDVILRLNNAGISVYFLPCYQRTWTSTGQQPLFKALTQAISRWGDRSPAQAKGENSNNRQMYKTIKASYPGNEFMCPVAFQDFRPNQGNYYESDHARTLHEMWLTAIGVPNDSLHVPADLVQIPTWNDYAEGAYIAPSLNHGWTFLDLSLWYMIKWKTGAYPKIVRDALYLTHRVQPTDNVTKMTYTGGQTKFMTKRSDGMTHQNTAGVVCFMTAAATVEINVGGRKSTHSVPAGFSTLRAPLMPLGTGLVSVRALRDGVQIAAVGSSELRRVKTKRVAQTMAYYGAKSLPSQSFATPAP